MLDYHPKVSINIPTYNQPEYLVKAIESVLSQGYENIEVNVGDDSDNKDSEDIVKERFRNEVNYYHHNPSLGRVGNYRFLLNKSSGEWALNLDGDDFLIDDTFVEKAVKALSSEPNAVMLGAKYWKYVNGEMIKAGMSGVDIEESKLLVLDGFPDWFEHFGRYETGHLTTLYKADVAKKIGFYEKDIITADSESVLRLALHGKVLFLNDIVAAWRQHGTNASRKSSLEEFYKGYEINDLVMREAVELGYAGGVMNKWKETMDIRYALRILEQVILSRRPQELVRYVKVLNRRKINWSKYLVSFLSRTKQVLARKIRSRSRRSHLVNL